MFHFFLAQPLIREGKIEVWVSRALNYGSNGGFRSRREVHEPLDTLLVHTKKQPSYEESFSSKRDSYVKTTHLSASENLLKPALYNVMETFTHSGYVDSFSDKFNVSEVKEQVLHFGASGEVLIHIRHVNLTRDEMMKRGGDKFKLFSIRVC